MLLYANTGKLHLVQENTGNPNILHCFHHFCKRVMSYTFVWEKDERRSDCMSNDLVDHVRQSFIWSPQKLTITRKLQTAHSAENRVESFMAKIAWLSFVTVTIPKPRWLCPSIWFFKLNSARYWKWWWICRDIDIQQRDDFSSDKRSRFCLNERFWGLELPHVWEKLKWDSPNVNVFLTISNTASAFCSVHGDKFYEAGYVAATIIIDSCN